MDRGPFLGLRSHSNHVDPRQGRRFGVMRRGHRRAVIRNVPDSRAHDNHRVMQRGAVSAQVSTVCRKCPTRLTK